jgi:hypothetical protein
VRIYKPKVPFKDAFPKKHRGASYDVVNSMTEEQLRYAMWAFLVAFVGGCDDIKALREWLTSNVRSGNTLVGRKSMLMLLQLLVGPDNEADGELSRLEEEVLSGKEWRS